MKTRWIWPAVAALMAVGLFGGNARAQQQTTTPGFAGKTLTTATFAEIDSHVVDEPQWQELLKTHGRSDLFVQQNTWDASTCDAPCIPSTGWHTHSGPSLVIVTAGSVTVYDGDDPACTPHVYTADTPNNAFIDAGGGHVHIIRDESGAVAKTVAVQFIPAGATRRQDVPGPGNCPF